MDLILIRHAESQFNARETDSLDSNLTKLGRKQAIEVSAFLKRRFDNIKSWQGYVSPYLRTLQTAKTIFDHVEVPFEVDFRIVEFASGTSGYRWEGPPVQVPLRKERFPDFFKNVKETEFLHKFEFDKDLIARCTDFLDMLKQRNGRYVVVSHAMAIYTMVFILEGTPMVPKWDRKILNTSVTYYKDDKLRYFARFVNSGRDPRPDAPEILHF